MKQDHSTKIAVVGAGAVGCYYGGMLARAGVEVVLIGRPVHVDAIRENGLRLETTTFTESIPVLADTDFVRMRGAGLVLCCVKSGDTEAVAALMAPHLDNAAIILSLQNGVDNAPRLAACLQREVLPAAVYVAAEMAGPGLVKHHGRGELVIGASSQAKRLCELFGAAAIPVSVSDNVIGTLWAKLAVNCVLNALSALTQLPYGRLAQGEGVDAVMRDVLRECEAVAQAEGVDLPAGLWEAVQGILRTMPQQLSSTAQDMRLGKTSEIDYLNGVIVRGGLAHGIPTPANQVLHTLVRLKEMSAGLPATT